MKLKDQLSKVTLNPKSSSTPAVLDAIGKSKIKVKIKIKEKK